jgi:Aerotolerance regulator N-terminal
MIAGLPLGFAQPLVLLALLSLPVLWWLLRLIPPQPRRIAFPPTRLLFDIAPREETPQRTPWWLTLLRLTLAALVIIAAAGPLWNPPVATSSSKAPLGILIDDGFPAAGTWDARMRTAEDLIARADADHRGVALIPPATSRSSCRRRRAYASSRSSRSRMRSSGRMRCRHSAASSLPRPRSSLFG